MTSEKHEFHTGEMLHNKRSECEPILRSLPEWFGLEEYLVAYLADIDRLPTFGAIDGKHVLGFLTVNRHFDCSAEIQVMAVSREYHRQGVGRRLVVHVEDLLIAQGVKYLQVKTIGPSYPDHFYPDTRAFYTSMGFSPLEETMAIWGEGKPCLIMVKTLSRNAQEGIVRLSV